jgi:hypothetical protein
MEPARSERVCGNLSTERGKFEANHTIRRPIRLLNPDGSIIANFQIFNFRIIFGDNNEELICERICAFVIFSSRVQIIDRK